MMTQRQPLHFTLRQLEVFLAIAQHRTTAAAALELSLSQSAVSSSLQTLENAYEMRLFDRVGKRLELNALGRHLRASAESLLAHARELEADMSGHENIGDLRIGASYTIANHLAIDYIAAWLEQYPNARIDISTGNSPEVIAQLLNYEIDVGLIENEINHADLELRPWMDDELVVFCSPEHALAQRQRLSTHDMLAVNWILRERDSGARQRFDQVFAPLLAELNVYLEFPHNEPIRRAVERGLGIGCLSEKVLQPYFDNGSLIPLTLESRYRMQRTFFICTRREPYRQPLLDAFVHLCLTESNYSVTR